MGYIKNKVIYEEEEAARIAANLQAVLEDLEKHEALLAGMGCAAGLEELLSDMMYKRYSEERRKRETAERALDLAVRQLGLHELIAENETDYYLKRAAAELETG